MNTEYSNLPADKKVYLASDFHLGVPSAEASLLRERKIIKWLDWIKQDAAAIMLVGDIFDFWFEYKHVVPKGFVRFLGKIAQLKDEGIPIFIFTGNHDMWMFDYLQNELGVVIIREPTSFQIAKHAVHIGHGDGLGPGDKTFKAIKRVFKNKLAQWAFSWVHPNVGFSLAHAWSGKSKDKDEDPFLGEEEWLLQYCRQMEKTTHHDYYIFGHRHIPLEMKVAPNSTYLNLGDWFEKNTYVEIDSQKATLKTFES